MSIISDIKAAVGAHLTDLVTEEVLAGATITEIKKSPLAAETSAYPWAYLMPPSVESETLDNRSITRTYTFDIMVLVRGEDLPDTPYMEELAEAIMNKYDNDPTLGGTARGGLLPVSSSPTPYQHNGQDLMMIIITIQAKADVTLTYGN